MPGDHATTFGGTPLATAAARAVLAEMQRIDVPALARSAGATLTERLGTVAGVKEVRGLGLLIAVELDGIDAKVAADLALDNGLVVNAVTASALRLAPALNVSEAEIDEAVAILEQVLAEAQSST